MAMAEFAENLKEVVICPVCMDCFTQPVTLSCGHSFCSSCLFGTCRETDKSSRCPLCRKAFQVEDVKLNSRLQKLVNIAKSIRPYLLNLSTGSNTCEKHQEEQRLFCVEDQTLLCASCFQTREHSMHTVQPIEKAAQDSRDTIYKTLNLLWKEVEIMQNILAGEREKMEFWDTQVDAWRESIRSQYKRLSEFLKNEEKWHLHRLSEDENENIKSLKESVARISQHLQCLNKAITDLEQNVQKSDVQLLQEVGGALKRSEYLLSTSPEGITTRLSVSQITGMWEMMKYFRVNVTLDPESACPYHIVSEDLKTVTHGGYYQTIPISANQFTDNIILGSQLFNFGMHYWEVDVGDSSEWSVGVCKASLSRTAGVPFPQGDVFLLRGFQKGTSFFVMITPLHIEHQTNCPIRKVGIFLDYDQGHISFYDALKSCLIFRFPIFHFSEPLKPIFSPCQPIEEENGTPMTIVP